MGVKCLPKTIDKNCERYMNSVIIIIKIITFHLHSTLQQNDLQSSFQMVLGGISWMSPRERLLGWDSAADNIVLRLSKGDCHLHTETWDQNLVGPHAGQ